MSLLENKSELSPNLFTHAECVQILNNVFNSVEKQKTLKDYKVDASKNAIGYLGEYYSLTLYYEDDNSDKDVKSLKLFVKTKPKNCAEAHMPIIFGKEVLFYEKILKNLQQFSQTKWFSQVFYTRPDCIVLEDLQLLNYNCGTNITDNLVETHMEQLLIALASLHAASIISELKLNINIGEVYGESLPEITVSRQVPWYTNGLQAIIACAKEHPKYQSKEMKNFIETKLVAKLDMVYDMVDPSKVYRNVFCHRDPWRANVFFKNDDDQVKNSAVLIDYQTCRYCPPAIDLLFAIYINLDREQRQLKEKQYLKFYYEEFKENIQHFNLCSCDYYSEEELLKSYKEFQLFGIVYITLAATIIKVPQEFLTDEYKYENRSKKVLEYMKENENFRNHMNDAIDEIMQLIL